MRVGGVWEEAGLDTDSEFGNALDEACSELCNESE